LPGKQPFSVASASAFLEAKEGEENEGGKEFAGTTRQERAQLKKLRWRQQLEDREKDQLSV
jgi:hypothetical protein